MENTLLRECHEHFRMEIEQQEITEGLGCAPPPPATLQFVHLFPLRDLLGAWKGRALRGAGCPLEGDRDRAVVAVPMCKVCVGLCGAPGGHKQLVQQTLTVPFILSPFKTSEMAELQCSWDVTARGEPAGDRRARARECTKCSAWV